MLKVSRGTSLPVLSAVASMLCLGLTQSAGASEKFPIEGRSGGGKFRAGPSMDSEKIGSLRESDPITILANVGNEMNEYDWFKIRFKNRVGYQWGGIICAKAKIKGVFKPCDEAGF